MISLSVILLSLNILFNTPSKVIVNTKNEGVNSWVISYLFGYIGRYHEYPESGADILKYFDEALSLYDGQFGYLNNQDSKEVRKSLNKAFNSKQCYYGENICIIPYKKEVYILDGTISQWQSSNFSILIQTYKPAFYDNNGNYLFRFTDETGDIFHDKMSLFRQDFRAWLRFNLPKDSCIPYSSHDHPVRVRVRYEKGKSVVLAEDVLIPTTAFIKEMHGSEMTIIDKIPPLEDMINQFKPFFEDFCSQYPEVFSIDCLIPLCLQ